jgi:hypothetical protein
VWCKHKFSCLNSAQRQHKMGTKSTVRCMHASYTQLTATTRGACSWLKFFKYWTFRSNVPDSAFVSNERNTEIRTRSLSFLLPKFSPQSWRLVCRRVTDVAAGFAVLSTAIKNTGTCRLTSVTRPENQTFWVKTLTGNLFPIILNAKNYSGLQSQPKTPNRFPKT